MHNPFRPVALLLTLTAALMLASPTVTAQASRSNTGPESKPARSRDTTSDRSTTPDKATTSTQKVDLNTASQEQLETLPGVGPATARAIVAARPFKSVNELTNINGISEARFAKLKPLVSVRPPRSNTEVGRAASGEKGTASSRSGASATRTSGQKININTASKEELENLPEIGPVRAQAIIDGRPYSRPEDIMKVKGIKEGVYDRIKDEITTR